VSVLPVDMDGVNCAPDENVYSVLDKQPNPRAAYVKKLLDKGIYAKSLLPYSIFKTEHLRDILRAVEFMPSWMNLTSNSDWKHIRVIYRPSLKSVANAFITIGPKWFDLESLHRQAVIIHELFHRLSTRIGDLAYTQEWIEASGSWNYARWVGRRWRLEALDERNFVSLYAMTNPSEDFAETVTLYRVNPSKLISLNSLKYNFVKDTVFLGKEFIDNSRCEKKPESLIVSESLIQAEIKLYVEKNYSRLKKEMKAKKNLKRVLLSNFKNNYRIKIYLENSDDINFLDNTRLYRRFN
jgi:hypothetical protein